MNLDNFIAGEGKPLPLGASLTSDGVNFSIFSRHATTVTLVLFESAEAGAGRREIALNRKKNRTGDIWHCFISGLAAGACYLYRADGPFQPENGLRFNPARALIDPYSKAFSSISDWKFGEAVAYDPLDPQKDLSKNTKDNIDTSPRCVVIDNSFDWQNDRPLNYPLRHSVIYETHVRGLTMHKSSGVEHPGTYLGLVEKIPYFKELGITGVELLPIHEFNENELYAINPSTGERLKNYWGYSTVGFFAPKGSYSFDRNTGAQVSEFKTMVRELHKAGIEVILDVVFNHTAEGNELGPTFSFRGLDNPIYYMLNDNKRYYQNYSGCGNTMNCNHPVVRDMIIDCLSYWVTEMHVDGFRFDLGSILGRNQRGRLIENAPMIERIAETPVLRNTKIIAEAWDAGGAYQVGSFPGRWAEWNDKFRDSVRKYWRGDQGAMGDVATRLCGSSDLNLRDGRKPFHSINFFACHDGFTLKDLVSYNYKHNYENGEDNRDGTDNNISYNYGYEGSPADPSIEAVRQRQMKNFIATLMISQGPPMLLGGDEFARTQNGCNNAYCQDNEISWYDWSLQEQNPGLFRFAKKMIAFRLRHLAFRRPEFYTGSDGSHNTLPDIAWFGEDGNDLNWEKKAPCFAFYIDGTEADIPADRDDNDFFIMFNSGVEDRKFTLRPPPAGKTWRRAVDTALPSPKDIQIGEHQEALPGAKYYTVHGRSVVILLSK
ncbi:MAG: glycogen debranching protein GlgX [Spirochaetaceae bacterium]|jgi:glycogen operon protein|nr:glycogen debranching protein GlgX [Spirochaetaceae bacterium]